MRIARLPGCKVTPEPGENTLECVLSAADRAHVREVLDAALAHHRYRLEELEACIEFDPKAWSGPSDLHGVVHATAQAVRESGGVRFVSLGRVPDVTIDPPDSR